MSVERTAPRTTTPREWALAVGGGLLLAAGLVWILRGDEAAAPAAEQLALVPAATAPLPAPLPSPMPAPMPPAPMPARAGALPSGLILRGIVQRPAGAAAIIEGEGGRQRLVRVGAAVAPGVRLLRIDGQRAVLAAGGGEQLLAFPDAPVDAVAAAATPAAPTTDWRLALAPVRQGGQLTGWKLATTDRLPMLARAGLQPGDVLVEANGSPLASEEKILELPAELAANGRLPITYQRDGQRRSAVIVPKL